MWPFSRTSKIDVLIPGIRARFARHGCQFVWNGSIASCRYKNRIIDLDLDEIYIHAFVNNAYVDLTNYLENIAKHVKEE